MQWYRPHRNQCLVVHNVCKDECMSAHTQNTHTKHTMYKAYNYLTLCVSACTNTDVPATPPETHPIKGYCLEHCKEVG